MMTARLAAMSAILTLALLPGAAPAQTGSGTAAGVAATVGATAGPPIAGGTGYRPAPVARAVEEDVDATGSIARAKHGHARKPHR